MDSDRHVSGRALAKHLGEWRAGDSGVAYLELAERIKLLVLDGRLPLRTRLPAERELAVALQVSRTTIAAGYEQLREAGYLHSRRGAGSWTTMPDGPVERTSSPFAPSADTGALDLAYAALPAPTEQLIRSLAVAGERAATLARRTHTPLAIDETMTELTLEGPAPTPFASLASDNGSAPVITVGSASKTFWGGIRIGWVRASRSMIERVARTKASVDIATSVLDQLVVEDLLSEITPVLAQRLPSVRSARDHLRSLVADRFPGWSATEPAGGLSLWIDLGVPVSSMLVTAASRHGVLLAAGPRFGLDGAFERFLRLPFTLPEPRLELAVERLATAWLSLSNVSGWEGAPAECA